jgi:transcriptional regulator GlxA family with amidase domain
MEPSRQPYVEIGIVHYAGALPSAIYGLTDQFMVANMLAMRHEGFVRPRIRVSHWQHEPTTNLLQRRYDSAPQPADTVPAIIIAPPSILEPITAEAARPYAAWLQQQHAQGALIGSVCAGSYLLGEANLLEGRRATTHWSYVDDFAARFPSIAVDGDPLLIDDGDIITTGGMMAWIDLGLRLVEKLMGPTLMMETARFMLVDPPGRQQRYYSRFSPRLQHGDAPILNVQHWLQKRGARGVNLKQMSRVAGLEERTFLRRFRKATGMNPTDYCQQIRINKAREMLEFTRQNIERIAWDVGYEDTAAFRKVFHRITGLTPGEYRTRFALTSTKTTS